MADERQLQIDLEDIDLRVTPEGQGEVPFYNSEGGNSNEQFPTNIGTIENEDNNTRRRTGKAEQYLESKGLGWLMETDHDEDMNTPLL